MSPTVAGRNERRVQLLVARAGVPDTPGGLHGAGRGSGLTEQRNQEGGASISAPLSSHLCEWVCLLGALWTLCSHLVVGIGGNLFWLVLVFTLACGGCAFIERRLRPVPLASSNDERCSPAPENGRLALAGAPAGIAAVCWFVLNEEPVGLWLGGLLSLSLGVASLGPTGSAPAPLSSSVHERALFGIGLACAVYALLAHRPEASDAFFTNIAIAAEGRMDLPLLGSETLHGRDDLPIHASLYRLQSYELFIGAVAWLTRVPPLYAFHWLAAGIGALLVPLAHAELFRRLTPRDWPVSVGIVVIVLLCTGETERWVGNHAFLRIWQGDGLFLFVFVPLLYSYAMRYAEAPSGRGLVRVAAAQIAALGCSAHAVWLAPVVVAGGLLAAAPVSALGVARVARGLLPSLYGGGAVVLLGVTLGFSGASPRGVVLGGRLDADIVHTFGDGALALVCLAASFVAWTCSPTGPGRRFAVLVPLAALLTSLNPWLGEWVYLHLTGQETWRTLWTLPVGVLVTLVIVSPLQRAAHLPTRVRLALSAALCGLFALAVPSHLGFSVENGVRIGAPDLKVPATAYRWAALLHEHAKGQRVVAPPDVSIWLPTFRDAPHPLLVLPYLDAALVGGTAYRDRYAMTYFAGGEVRHIDAAALFARGLELYGVSAACIRVSEHIEQTRSILRRAGYQRRVQASDYEIWVRT